MTEYNLSGEQWCFLDLLMRARSKGVDSINRIELLHSKELPQAAALKLVWAALSMPDGLVTLAGAHNFSITDAGASLYNLKFGSQTGRKAVPTEMADAVICLPGPDHYAKLN